MVKIGFTLFQWSRLVLVVLLTVACSSTNQVEERKFELLLSADDIGRTWPKGPQSVHYRYLGDIYGESNLTAIKQAQESTLGKIWSFLTGNVQKLPTNIKRPQSIIGDNYGRLFIADVSSQAIFVLDTVLGTQQVWKNATEFESFVSPIGLSFGLNNELLVADSELGFIVRLDQNGVPKGVIDHPLLERPTGILRSAQRGEIYVSDTRQHNIKVFNDQGELLRIIGKKGEGALEFNSPTFLAWHPKGLLVSDTLNARVQLLTYENNKDVLVRSFGRRGMKLGNLTRPKGVAADSNGNMYIIESYFDHLLVYNEKNQFLLPLGGTGHGAGEFYLPSGVWIDSQDKVYIADMMNGRISVFQFVGGNL